MPCNVAQAVSQGWLFLPHQIARECVKEGVLDNEQASVEFGTIYCNSISKKKDGVWGLMVHERDQVFHFELLLWVHPSRSTIQYLALIIKWLDKRSTSRVRFGLLLRNSGSREEPEFGEGFWTEKGRRSNVVRS